MIREYGSGVLDPTLGTATERGAVDTKFRVGPVGGDWSVSGPGRWKRLAVAVWKPARRRRSRQSYSLLSGEEGVSATLAPTGPKHALAQCSVARRRARGETAVVHAGHPQEVALAIRGHLIGRVLYHFLIPLRYRVQMLK